MVTNYADFQNGTFLEVDWRTIYLALTVVTNLLSTGLIVYRIVHVTAPRERKSFRGVIEILVESSLLYSVTYAVYLAVWAYANYNYNWVNGDLYPSAFLPAVTVRPSFRCMALDSSRQL